MTSFGKRPSIPDLSTPANVGEEVHRDESTPVVQSEPPENQERRRYRRRRALKGAYISYNDHHFTIPCMVRNVSERGALLRIDDHSVAPNTFVLHIELDSVEVDCEVVWRSNNEVGIKFVSVVRTVKPSRVQVVASSDQGRGHAVKRHPIR
ncbi:MAG: PilZ domain-containing protein [Fimbriimonadaceae bacterium]|nr:PilZ domain-containing protein [Alphaproteobacteria bacterium]